MQIGFRVAYRYPYELGASVLSGPAPSHEQLSKSYVFSADIAEYARLATHLHYVHPRFARLLVFGVAAPDLPRDPRFHVPALFHSLVRALYFHPQFTSDGFWRTNLPDACEVIGHLHAGDDIIFDVLPPGTLAGLLYLFVELLATPFFLSTFSAGAELFGSSRFDDQLAFVDFLFTDVNPDPALLHPASAGRVPGARAAFRAVLLHPDPAGALPADAPPQDPRLNPHWNGEWFLNDSFFHFPIFFFS